MSLSLEAIRSGAGLETLRPEWLDLWLRVPDGHTSASFASLVLEEANVVVSPGPAYGPSGEGFVRLSLTVSGERLEEAVRRIETSLRTSIIQA